MKIQIDEATMQVIKDMMQRKNIDTLRIDYAENS